MRLAVWSIIIALAVAGHVLGDERYTAAIAPVVIVFLWFGAPAALRGAVAAMAVALLAAWLLGGVALLVDVLPTLFAALIGWFFARSLLHSRQPFIARAIAKLEGAEQLADPAVTRYAKRLTQFWTVCQFALAAFGILCVAHVYLGWPAIRLPAPALFGALILPSTVIVLFVVEFTLRPLLLPQAKRQGLFAFVRDLAVAWPQLIEK